MTLFFFALGNFLFTALMATLWVLGTGRVDGHFGILGSVLKTFPSTTAMCLLSTLVFGLLFVITKRSASRRRAFALGAIAAVLAYVAAWIAHGLLGQGVAGIVGILGSFIVGAASMIFFTRPRSA